MFEAGWLGFFFLKAATSWLLPPYSLSVGALYITIT